MSLPHLTLWTDLEPRPGPLNMALDEALLLSQNIGPWLRVYQWTEPFVSLGFSQPLSMVPPEHASWPVVRRWTGGGVVVHDGDWTYTLGAPAGSPLSEQRAVETYREIHEAMILALADAGLPGGVLQPENTSDGMGVCFVEPAKYDVVWQGQKVAGAAQRRSKTGFLHQGTIQPLKIPPGFGLLFAQRLATQVQVLGQPEANALLLPVALELVESKYGYPEWNTHRSTRPLSV